MRFLLTHSDPDALTNELVAAGHATVHVQLVVHEDVAVDWASLPRADWLLLTSANAARLAHGHVDVGAVAAVGRATAASWGHVDVVGEGTGAEVVASMGPLVGKTVLWPRAERAAPATRDALHAAGAHLVDVVAYRNVANPHAAEQLQAAGPWDVALLASPAAAEVYAAAALAPAARIVVIGPTTADAARRLGLVVAVATTWDASGVLAAID